VRKPHPAKRKAVKPKSVHKKSVHKKSDNRKAGEKKTPSLVASKKLRRYQSFIYALLGGLIFTLISSLAWVVITATTGFSGAYMAIGAGLVVGIAIRYFGAGIHWVFGMLAALLTLAGSLMGYYLSQTSLLEVLQLESMIHVLDYMILNQILITLLDAFVPLDLVYYILAAMLAYILAIRRIGKKKMLNLESDDVKGAPALYWLRLPLILAGILIPAYYGYTLTNQDTGGIQDTERNITLFYETGEKMSEGAMKKDLETGEWTSWHENGNIKSRGYYTKGQMDGPWKWYNEEGVLTGTGTYGNGVESGIWMSFYPDGVVSDSGSYLLGLKEGLWKYYHENGNLKYSVNYKAGLMHGEKILLTYAGNTVKVDYFENGILVEKD
jgi:antitoxin component YwqK of YwqJK toxin-antitoxin module